MQAKIRLKLVHYAQEHGIKAASKYFACSRNTIRTWLRRYESKGSSGLVNHKRAPKNIPHKVSKEEENKIIEARMRAPCYGPKRLKWFFDVHASESAIGRILKQNHLTKKRRKKYQTKNDLREVKARYRALTHHQLDVKHLYDIPYYWPQMTKKKLPKYQYTLRDTKSGLLYLGYGKEYNEAYSELFIDLYLGHLEGLGVDVSKVVIQTDNGAEFGGNKRRKVDYGITNTIQEKYKAEHRYIPPGHCNANADVESIHATIEQELFDLESFEDHQEFMVKTQAYQYFYNMVRPNFSKKGKTPSQILFEDREGIDVNAVFYPVIDLDEKFREKMNVEKINQEGQYVPKLPVLRIQSFVDLFNCQI